MKNLIFILILLFCSTLLFSQVNFEIDFSFEKIDPDDTLTNIQLFDYDGNNIDELFVGYDGEMDWKLVCYDLSGDTLFTYSQEKLENEFFKRFHLYKDEDVSLMISTSIIRNYEYGQNDSLSIQVVDLESFTVLCSMKYSIDVFWLIIDNINSIIIQKTETNYIIYLGYNYESISIGIEYYRQYSDIIKIQFENNSLTFIETIPKSGLSIYYNETINKYVSYGFYKIHNEMTFNSSGYYYLKLIDPTTNPIINTILTVSGSAWLDEVFGVMYYSNWPLQFKILTLNDENTYGCGPIIYYNTLTLQSDTRERTINLFFKSYLTDFSSIGWENNDSHTGTSNLISSTCISVNDEDHFVMYFRENQLEIRDRINGDIIHHQDSTISPFKIKRKSDGELVFFVEQEDETGYDIYIIEEEIQVSVNENEVPVVNYELRNHPNPFNPSTTITFSLNDENINGCEILIYNLKGQKVKELKVFLSGDEGNSNSIVWYGTDQNNKPVSSGIYFYQLKVNEEIKQTKKMILLK